MIVIGVDGSNPSRAALQWGVRRGARLGEPVRLVHVADEEWGQAGREVADEEEHRGAVTLAEAARDAHSTAPALEIEQQLTHGSAAGELVAACGPEDLLVVGTHKTGYILGRVLGTQSIVMAFAAPCSVAVIPENFLAAREGVVVGIADDGTWAAAVEVGAQEAKQRRQELTLLHSGADTVLGRARGRSLLADAAKAALQSAPELTVVSRFSGRRPAESLLDASRRSSMLVLGVSRRDRAELIGSVAHEVLLNINSPVVVAR
jgi:nucleotide-binding universal stress UspA family protein